MENLAAGVHNTHSTPSSPAAAPNACRSGPFQPTRPYNPWRVTRKPKGEQGKTYCWHQLCALPKCVSQPLPLCPDRTLSVEKSDLSLSPAASKKQNSWPLSSAQEQDHWDGSIFSTSRAAKSSAEADRQHTSALRVCSNGFFGICYPEKEGTIFELFGFRGLCHSRPSQVLSSRHLPPTSLPFSSRKVSEKTAQQEQEERLAEANFAQQEWQSHQDAELQKARLKIRSLEEQQASGSAPTFPTTQHPLGGQTTGLTIGQPNPVLPSSGQRGPWASTRDFSRRFLHNLHSVAPASGVASTHSAALPAMMVPNPSTPLGAFPTQSPLPAYPQLPADEHFKREKSPLPKLVIKGGDATSVTRVVHEWLQKTAMALNTWSSSAIQLCHHAVGLAKGAHLQWSLMAPSQRALKTGLPSTGNSLPPQLSRARAIACHPEVCNDRCRFALLDLSDIFALRAFCSCGRTC